MTYAHNATDVAEASWTYLGPGPYADSMYTNAGYRGVIGCYAYGTDYRWTVVGIASGRIDNETAARVAIETTIRNALS